MTRTITLSLRAALLAATTIAGSAAAGSRPDVACMDAGIKADHRVGAGSVFVYRWCQD